jgi:chromosome segregation protein
MRLKRLQVYGYKSFASRCAFEFGDGITAIVGPNGSGKSNVADAVRWVLGEQSYRLLRAHATEDMIFAGTSSRSRLGMAEVILTFDNADGWLPIDYSEVTVGRRAYRSGENEYLLNGNRVRYRDIVDLLGPVGLARSSYLVIGQGMVDAALALRPEARRVLFEEAAGIGPHLRKREEAHGNIAETERNLERVQDILAELRPRAEMLRRQADRAEEHQLLRQDLRELQRIWYGYEWQRLRRGLAVAEEGLRERRQQGESQRQYARECQERIRELEAEEARQAQAVEEIASQAGQLRSHMEGLRREMAVAAERRRLYQQQLAALQNELQSLASRRAIVEQEVTRTQQELDEHFAAGRDAQDELDAARQALQTVDAARAERSRQLASQERRLGELTRSVTQTRLRAEELVERQARLRAEVGEFTARAATLAQRAAGLETRGEQLVQQEAAAAQAHEAAQGQLAAVERDLAAARQCVADAEGAASRARGERNQLAMRRDSLERVRQELTGYHPGVRQALSPQAGLRGILGAVANLMHVPREYEAAIESALGARLQNIVTERWQDAEAAIALLKQNRGGWATFLPLDTLRVPSALSVPVDPDVVGVGSRLVRYEERLRPVFELLLGRIVVTPDLAAARRLLKARTGASLLVTLEGETVQPSGALSGGTRATNAQLLSQEREWRDLPAGIAEAEGVLEDADRAVQAAQAHLQALQERRRVLERDAATTRQRTDTAHDARAAHRRDESEVEREREWLEGRQRTVTQEIAALSDQGQTLSEQVTQAQAEQLPLAQAARELRDQLIAADNEPLRQRVAALETRLAVTQRTAESQRRLLASHRESLSQLCAQVDAKAAQHAELSTSLARLEQEAQGHDQQRRQMEERAEAAQQRIEPARQARIAAEQARREAEQLYAGSLDRLHEAESEVNQLSLQRDRVQDQRDALMREVEIDLGPIDLPEGYSRQLRLNLGDDVVELPQVPSLPVGLEEEIRHLRARLRRLGDVNPDAPREYEQLLERQTFMQGQVSDLKGAIASLHEIIQELDVVIERDFVRTVQVVDEAFRSYFTRLFGGGTARLSLTSPDDPSATGVEIIAHPPGKRPQQLSLLSGGERALTAVALLFALLRANPVPFCFLDEVDAALDEANVGRFRDLLAEHARTTQFIVITHNRHTIDAAGALYGISMSELGISQTVSLKLSAEALSEREAVNEGAASV